MQFRVGVLVVATFLIAAILLLLFSDRPTLLRSSKTIYVELPTARGVSEGTRVLKRGVLIGRVTKVAFTEDGVKLTLEIDRDVKIERDEQPVLQSTLLGDAEVEFVRNPQQQGTRVVPTSHKAPADDYTLWPASQPVLNAA